MRHAYSTRYLPRNPNGGGLLFSAAFVGAILAITSVLYALDIATMRSLLSFP